MRKYVNIVALGMLTLTLAACSGSNDDNSGTVNPSTNPDPSDDPIDGGTAGTVDAGGTDNGATDTGTTDTGTTDTGTTDTGTTDTGNADAGVADAGATDGGGDTDGGTTSDTDGDGVSDDLDNCPAVANADQLDADGNMVGDVCDTGDADGGFGNTEPGTSNLGNPPVLADPFAAPIASPDSADPFGQDLEIDNEQPVAGGAPTTPKNLRVDLVSNDWAELNWAPSNDDVGVDEYRLYRSDGVIYTIRGDVQNANAGVVAEANKIWNTTSFIDCNYTRFVDRVHFCNLYGPEPGNTYSYQITAVDADGQESPRSNSVTVLYHQESNAAVPRYDDFYKHPDDSFAQDHDLSDTSYFLDKFTMVFEDNFDGPAIDSTKWNTGLTWGDNNIINGEQQYFVNTQQNPGFGYDPFKFENGDLVIEAIKIPDEFRDSLPPVCDEPDPSGLDRCEFLSGALSSHDKFGMTYGYVEGRMKVSDISGALSSFYLYHRYPGTDKNLHAPEIDIVEYLGENPFGDEDAFQTYHYADVTHGTIRSAPTMSYKNPTGAKYDEDYHTFGVLWEPQLVIWYIDGKEIKRLSGVQVGRQQMNIVTYLVTGSAWAPTPSSDDSQYPIQYKIDYIRAYQRAEYNGNGLYPDQ